MKSLSSYLKEDSGSKYEVGRECYFDSTRPSYVKKLCNAIEKLNRKYEGIAAGEVFPDDEEDTTLFSTYAISEDDLEVYEQELAIELGNLAEYADFDADIFDNY